jgi:hypothetical protein
MTTAYTVDAYMVAAVPLVATLDPYAVNNDQVLIEDFSSDSQTQSLAATDTESVTGAGIITLPAGAVVALNNQTESGVTPQGDTALQALPLGGTASINVQLRLVRVG